VRNQCFIPQAPAQQHAGESQFSQCLNWCCICGLWQAQDPIVESHRRIRFPGMQLDISDSQECQRRVVAVSLLLCQPQRLCGTGACTFTLADGAGQRAFGERNCGRQATPTGERIGGFCQSFGAFDMLCRESEPALSHSELSEFQVRLGCQRRLINRLKL